MMAMSSQVVVAALGNITYPFTRHSIGQLVLDSLAHRLDLNLAAAKESRGCVASSQNVPVGDEQVSLMLLKTTAFMNLSGPPISKFIRSNGLSPSSLIVLHDSLSHKPLSISVKYGGSANGHNGIRSLVAAFGNNPDFHRLRIGIGKNVHQDAADYVMRPISDEERAFWGPSGPGVDRVWKQIEKIISDS